MVSAVRPAGAAVLTLVSLLACDRTPPASCAPYTEDLGRFVAEAGGIRPTAGRMCGGFRHAPMAAVGEAARDENASASRTAVVAADPAAADSSTTDAAAPLPVFRGLARTAFDIRRAAVGGSPEELAAAGVVSLVDGRWREAVELLEQAAEQAPAGDPRYLVDLANAYLDRARAEDDPLELLLAAETAERAVELAPELPEALFTLAVTLERVGLGAEAAAVWRRFLTVETAGGWADEARQRSARLAPEPSIDVEAALLAAMDRADAEAVHRLVDRHRQRARELGERLLGEWAKGASAGDGPGAALALARAGALGRTLVELDGDRLLADSVAAIEHAVTASLDRGPSRRLLAGHLAHAAGQAADAVYDAARARERFTEAERELSAAASPFADRSLAARAAAAHRLSRWEEALEATGDLSTDPEVAERYPSLAARAQWLRGLTRLVAGRPSAARDHYQSALTGFDRAGEVGNSSYVRVLLAEERWLVGERSAAWSLWTQVLRSHERLDSGRNRHALFDVTADALAQLDRPRIELRLRDRLVALNDRNGTAVDRSHALLKRSRTLFRIGRGAEAQRDLELTEKLLVEIADDEMRERVRVDLLISRARSTRAADAARASAALSEAIQHYRSRDKSFPLPELLFARARLRRRSGEIEAAERDLRAAVAALEDQRREIREVLTRGAFLVQAEELFDELVALLADQPGREGEALMAAEQGRSRALLDLALRSPAGEDAGLASVRPQDLPPLERILESLPAGREAVVYSILEHETLVWILDSSGVRMRRLEVSETDLAMAARELVAAAGSGASAEAVAAVADRLSALIYRPIAPLLSSTGTLLVVPDGPLVGVPFAVVGGRQAGRFLIAERPVAMLPTAALLVRGRGRAGEVGEPGRLRTLVVGPPASPSLSRLAGGEREAERIARIHPGAHRIDGAAATEAAMLSGLAESDLIHFAGHAVPDSRDPIRSALILSADGEGGDGRLEVREILLRRFDRAPAVVLAACATHDHLGRPETGITLGTALLASGAGGVVATLWPVEDPVTERMMVELHRELAARVPLAEALAKVQGRRTRTARPRDWAGWVVLGR